MLRSLRLLFCFAICFGFFYAATTAEAADVQLPARGCFYYPWFPETWTVNGQHVSGDDSAQPDDGFHPVLGFYNSSTPSVADSHGQQLNYARCEVPIMSWWGPGRHSEQTRIPLLLDRWWIQTWGYLKPTIYYECEGDPATGTAGCPGAPDPSVAQIQAHLIYLSTYANHSRWARVNGKPVIFVYSSGETNICEVSTRWKQAAPNWYVSLKLSSGFASCANQPDAWHQYGPSTTYARHAGHYTNISPGFWRADEVAPRTPGVRGRDLARFNQQIRDMIAAGDPWQLVTSFNEWGEGTAIENATEWPAQPPFHLGAYVDALYRNGN